MGTDDFPQGPDHHGQGAGAGGIRGQYQDTLASIEGAWGALLNKPADLVRADDFVGVTNSGNHGGLSIDGFVKRLIPPGGPHIGVTRIPRHCGVRY